MKTPYRIRLLQDSLPLYTGAGTGYIMIGSVSDNGSLEIIEERNGKGAQLWGRLRTCAGWIPLDQTEIIGS